MSKLGSDDKIAAEVIQFPAEDWLTSQYLPFAMYAIQDRALVGSSGLKPVQRRILWAMYTNGITPTASFMKASRAASLANAYHPHASSSIEGALATMAQGFNTRVPLIDPYGSVGKVAGDVPSAARYWEARLTKEAMELVKELADGAVPMGKNFDGELDEPMVLPVRWPVDIINGTQGIAVGYASSMVGHNPGEVMDACRKMLKQPNMTVEQLMRIMPGPDLATGGELFGIDGVKDYYTTGSGGFTVRARYHIEDMSRGRKRFVFYELPYQVSAEKIVERIRELKSSGKFKEIASENDLSDKKSPTRLVIETKAGTNHLSVLAELFKQTKLEEKFSVNATVLLGETTPKQVGMLTLIANFLKVRKECTLRKAQVRIDKIKNRLHQLNAILAVLIDIDKAIAIIRKAATADEARVKLETAFSIDDVQANYILSMQLRRLTRQDSLSVKNEKKELDAESKELKKILTSEAELMRVIDTDLLATKKIIASDRRTIISGFTTEELKESQKEVAQAARAVEKNLPCVVTRFADGRLLKSDSAFTYRGSETKLSNSPIVEQLKFKTQDHIVLVGSDGIGRRLPLSYLTHGMASKPADVGVHLPKGVRLVGMARNETPKSDVGLAMATKLGKMKLAKTDFPKGDEFPVFLLDKNDEVMDSRWIGKTLTNTYFSLITASGNILLFDATSLRLSGSKAGGVAGMKLKTAKDRIVNFGWVQSLKDGTTFVASQGAATLKLTPISEIPPKNKGGMGVAVHNFKKGETEVKNAFVGVNATASLEGFGNAVPLPPATKRAARGVDFTPEVMFGSVEVTAL